MREKEKRMGLFYSEVGLNITSYNKFMTLT